LLLRRRSKKQTKMPVRRSKKETKMPVHTTNTTEPIITWAISATEELEAIAG
jgi:hypothetical protein